MILKKFFNTLHSFYKTYFNFFLILVFFQILNKGYTAEILIYTVNLYLENYLNNKWFNV